MERAAAPATEFALSDRAKRTADQPIGYLIATALANPHVISLAAGLVDYETLPSPETRALMSDLLTDDAVGRARLNYGTTLGLPALRQTLVQHLARLDGLPAERFGATADQIVVANGSQQLLALLTDALVNPGDIVMTAWPSYFVYSGVLITAGADVRCVDIDEQGIVPGKLDELLASIERAGHLERVKIVYVVSYHDNPTGVTLAEDRRPELLRIVRKYSRRHRILLLEDAAYRELTFEGEPPHSIYRSEIDDDPSRRQVALLQTFSKPFAPGVKVGYGLLPADLVEKIALMKDNLDFGTANLNQHLVLRAMSSGLYDRHVRMLRRRYHEKAACMLAALQEHLGDLPQAHWTHPRGGLYVWLTLPPSIDTNRGSPLFQQAISEGVLYVPGSYCYGPDNSRQVPRNSIRLSFGTATLEHIREGIRRLSVAIRKVSRTARPASPAATAS
jgi:2-aminoadipate transaminase